MKIIEGLIQRSKEWLAWRNKHICASDSPIILGLNPWETPYQLWLSKLGSGAEKQTTEDMQRGIDNEDQAREILNSKLGMKFQPACVESESNPFLAASLDGLHNSTTGMYICEIKCSNKISEADMVSGTYPNMYFIQMQHQLLITKAEVCFFANFRDGELHFTEVLPNVNTQEMILEETAKFWDLLQNFEAPELTSKDYVERNDREYQQWCIDWNDVQKDKKNILEREESLRYTAIELSQKQNIKGCGFSIQHNLRKGNVQYKDIPELKNVDLEKYRKEPIKIMTIRECNS